MSFKIVGIANSTSRVHGHIRGYVSICVTVCESFFCPFFVVESSISVSSVFIMCVYYIYIALNLIFSTTLYVF